ncbi:MAG TPA: Fur family transcriptional regulator [bacterium]|nr:Fur family transcriptional regulator [bacterium]
MKTVSIYSGPEAGDGQKYEALLKEHGYKLTPRRRAIIRLLGQGTCATPERIWRRLKPGFGRLGLPTVYRNLEEFRKAGVAARVAGPEERFYYGLCRARRPDQHHHHIVCEKCRRVSEVSGCRLEGLAASVKKETGFQVTEHRLELVGLCRKCRTRTGKSKPNTSSSREGK